MSDSIEDDLQQQLIDTFGSHETAAVWLQAPHRVLAGEPPAAYVQRGDTAAVRRLLMMAETGMPT